MPSRRPASPTASTSSISPLANGLRTQRRCRSTGEGAAGDQGSDAWYWLRKDPASNQSTAGSGTPLRTFSVGALRQHGRRRNIRRRQAAARGGSGDPRMAPDLRRAAGRARRQREGVRPAAIRRSTARIASPTSSTRFDARRGYRSRLRVVKAGAGAGGGLLDLLGGLL